MNKNTKEKVIVPKGKKGPRTFKEKEALTDKAIELILMGFDKPYHLMKMLPVANMNTAKRYFELAEKRIGDIYERVGDREKALKKDLADLEMAEQKVWDEFLESKKKCKKNETRWPMSINTVTQSIVKIKERRAKLLGLDITNLNLSGNVGLNVAEIARIVREEAGKEQADGGGAEPNTGTDDSEHSEGN